jgi:metallo-beta-lactamase class B
MLQRRQLSSFTLKEDHAMLKPSFSLGVLFAFTTGAALAAPTIEELQSSAKRLAGTDWAGTYLRLCIPTGGTPVEPTLDPDDFPSAEVPRPPGGPDPIANWYAPPAKVGDNFYFLGERAHNAFALVSRRQEIIVFEALFDYATGPEILDGLKALGLNPKKVRYVLIAHEHGDHDGGAYILEREIPGVTIVYGAAAWPSVMARTGPHATRFGPQNDGTDGRVIMIDDISVQIITMPGHTPGTISFLFEFLDNGKPIKVAYVGGTAISFTQNAAYYDLYLSSARKFAQAAADFGADALMSNHTEFDNGYFRAHTAANQQGRLGRNPNVPHPYFVGQQAVINYMGVVELCTEAAKLRATGSL